MFYMNTVNLTLVGLKLKRNLKKVAVHSAVLLCIMYGAAVRPHTVFIL